MINKIMILFMSIASASYTLGMDYQPSLSHIHTLKQQQQERDALLSTCILTQLCNVFHNIESLKQFYNDTKRRYGIDLARMSCDQWGNNPLHVVVLTMNQEVIEFVMNLNPRFVEGLNNAGLTPLDMAADSALGTADNKEIILNMLLDAPKID